MYANSPFLVRRVLGGVLVGVAVLAVVLFGWAHYQISQYHQREAKIVSAYAAAYRSCMSTQGAYGQCASRVSTMCTDDSFWRTGQPFTLGLGQGLDESATKCAFGSSAN